MSRRRREEFFRQLSTQPRRFEEWTEVLREFTQKQEEGEDAEELEELERERLLCEAERKEQRKTAQTLQRLVDKVLPEELVMVVLAHVVDRKAPELELKDGDTLPITSRSLLGLSPPAQKLYPLVEQVLLERSHIKLNIPFTRLAGGGEPIAQVPAFVTSLPHPIRHLKLLCNVEIRGNRLTYPITIFRFTRGASSLRNALPDLHSFTLVLNLDVEEASVKHALDLPCFCGYTATTTYRELVLKMLSALFADGPGRQKKLKVTATENRCDNYFEGDQIILAPSTPAATNSEDEEEEPAHPMKAVLDQACKLRSAAKQSPKEEKPAKPKAHRRRPAAAVRLRSNSDMAMLEDETARVMYGGAHPSAAQAYGLTRWGEYH